MKTMFTTVAVKLLAGTHLVGQTVADLSLNAEIKLKSANTNEERKAIRDARIEATMAYQSKAGIYSPFKSIQDMDASQQ